MSTNVIRPGVATKQTPSGRNFVMLVAGVAVAIAVGFAFYTSQSQDVTVSGLESQAGPTLTDTWLVNRQNAVNTARDEAAAYETARMTAMGESYAATEAAKAVTYGVPGGTGFEGVVPGGTGFEGVTDSWMLSFEASQVAAREAANAPETARLTGQAEAYENSISASVLVEESIQEALGALQGQPSAAVMIEESIQEALLAHQQAQQAQTEAQGEFYGVVELSGTNVTVGPQALALQEIADHFMVAEIKGSQGQSGNGVNPNFDHEFEPVQDSGPSGSGNPITLPVR